MLSLQGNKKYNLYDKIFINTDTLRFMTSKLTLLTIVNLLWVCIYQNLFLFKKYFIKPKRTIQCTAIYKQNRTKVIRNKPTQFV